MAVALTPNTHLAPVVSSAFYSIWNPLSGFLVPKPPGRGIITSQLGDAEDIIVGPGFKGTVKEFLKETLDLALAWLKLPLRID
ncbi:hypothetical protein Syun_017423 [Stephania yunnanensis]|uniref:Uncharacterized protein n=1 Tax=Stephania yunnanensis TaxID=152371 RepID=A0AAP0J956_9MAGN